MQNKGNKTLANADDFVERALPVSQQLLIFLQKIGPDLLVSVAALEAAKISLVTIGRQQYGNAFAEKLDTVMCGIENAKTIVDAVVDDGSFTQGGGDA